MSETAGGGSDDATARWLGLAVLGLALLALRSSARAPPAARPARPVRTGSGESRVLHAAAAMLSLSVLADSAVEHYRGSFENPGMYVPLIASAAAFRANIGGALDGGQERMAVHVTAIATGAAGTGFHVYDIFKRPGGLGWLNLFYAAPPGAPAALALAGMLGIAADHLRDAPAGREARLLGLPAGPALAALASAGIAGTVAEAGLLHFRGAFQNPFMFAPVTVPPLAALLLARAATGRAPRGTRFWLGATVLLGIAGAGFHAYGVSRAMGGWRNWSQNLVDGPPLPAPPAFAALALAGLAALSLIERTPLIERPGRG
jgi:hypothetical protein